VPKKKNFRFELESSTFVTGKKPAFEGSPLLFDFV